jgi:hypothetical protein
LIWVSSCSCWMFSFSIIVSKHLLSKHLQEWHLLFTYCTIYLQSLMLW